ncbi:MAG: hypothetical protein R2710_00600 [Acidimicrobiales bacterium]
MSAAISHDTSSRSPMSMTSGHLPAGASVGIGIAAIAVGSGLAAALGGFHPVKAGLIAAPLFLGLLYAISASVEGARKAKDRVATATVTGAFGLVMIPLVSLLWTVVTRRSGRMDATFFTDTMRNVVGEGGGIKHALIGTLIVTGLATLFSVPFGLFTAVYLVEYGDTGSRLSRVITMMVDVMTGIPSIVAGLFAYSLFVLFQGSGARSGLAGAVALTVLMTPVVIRSSEEMLRLVQNEAPRGVARPRGAEVEDHHEGRAAHLDRRHPHRCHARHRPSHRRDGAIARHRRPGAGHQLESAQRPYDHLAGSGLLQLRPAHASARALDRSGVGAALVLIIVVAILFTLARVLATILKPKGLR